MKRSGFSLLELSIVLTILAIIVAGGLTLSSTKIQQDEIVDTYDEMEEITTALQVFLNEHGRLPCPASITLTYSDALYGREATDCADASPPAGLTRVEYPAASGEYVRIGGVPFYSLEIPDRFIGDSWGGRYLYAVHEDAITALTSSDTGTIRVVDGNGTSITDAAVMAIVSHGKSRKGAYTAKTGAVSIACDATNKDGENCDGDGIFTDAVYNDGAVAANFYDDLIIWKTRMGMFETVSVSGAFKPWEFGEGFSASSFPLQIKGITAATFAGNATLTALNAGCAAEYANSWMLRSSDLNYVDNIPVIAAAARMHIDDCVMDTANNGTDVYCSLQSMPQIRLNASGTISAMTYTRQSVNHLNCLDWANSTASYAQVTLLNSSAATNFRKRPITSSSTTTFTAQSFTDGTMTLATTTCSTSTRLVCVGER